MADLIKQNSNLKVDFVVSRKIYKFPGIVAGSRIFGSPHLIHQHSIRLKLGGSESYSPPEGVIIANAKAYALSVSTTTPPSLGVTYHHSQDIRATIQGKERKYIGFKSAVGHVTPLSTTSIREAINTFKDVTGGLLEFFAGFLNADVEIGVLTSQALPSHHLGLIRIESSIKGITAEGGTLTDNYAVLSNSNISFVHDIYTEAVSDFITGRRYWDEFLLLSSDQRKAAIKYVREAHGLSKRSPPSPNPTPSVYPSRAGFYPFWALERNLDPTAPPTDVRRVSYPGYKKRTLTPVR